jgi:ABC-type branched-subunit amino acid transport system ATPase component
VGPEAPVIGSPLFRAEGLVKRFGGVLAVDSVSLAVPEHSIFAVIGPNGAGKSTLVNLLSGIYPPDQGSLEFTGRTLAGLPAYRRVRLGMARTFQKIRLFKQLSALENVLAGFHTRHRVPWWQHIVPAAALARDRTRCHAEALELLAFVGLAERAAARAGALAYGEQRMLEIARALATGPRLLLLDEPAAGLNAAEVERLIVRLEAMRRDGLTLIVVEHNMDLVMTIADHVLVIDHGQFLFEGSPAEVQRHPGVIAAYLGAAAA